MARYSRNDQAGIDLPKAKLDRENLKQALELFRYLRPYRGRFNPDGAENHLERESGG